MSLLTDLSSADLRRVLRLRLQIERYERQMLAIYQKAKARPQKAPDGIQRVAQPSLRDLVTGILRKADKPLTVPEIYEATLLAEYHWRSRDPINALNVKMYTDRTFRKVAPGRFVLRSKQT